MSDGNEINKHYPDFLNKDFVQVRQLDKGAFGKIFVARRKDDSKVYVLKMINSEDYLTFSNKQDEQLQSFSSRLNEVSSRKPQGDFKIGIIPFNDDDDFDEDDFQEQQWDIDEDSDNINNDIQWGFDEDLDKENSNSINEMNQKSNVFESNEDEEDDYEYVTVSDNDESYSEISEFETNKEEPIKLSGEITDKEVEEKEIKQISIDKTNLQLNETSNERVKVVVIQMEYCSGSNLSRIIESQELHYSKKNANEKINFYFKQIITGIQYIHSKNIIHGDLKPANIFRDGDILKIGDFGYATMAKNRNKCKFVGTPGYTAPEVSSGDYDTSIDIYSLGIILLEMCMSCVTRSEFILGIELIKKRQINETVSKYFPQLSQLILNMTEFDPKKRPDANQILEKISGMEETQRKLEYIKPLLQNHNSIFQSIVNKATSQINNNCVFREQYIQSIKFVEDQVREINKKIGAINCFFYPIIPFKWIADETVTSPMMNNSDNELLVILNNFVDLMKVIMINRKKISTTNTPLHIQIPLYELGSNDVINFASTMLIKPSSDESIIFDMCDVLQEVNEIMKKCCNIKYKIIISNSQINDIIVRLPKIEQNKLFNGENTLKNTLRSLKLLKKNKVFSNDSSIQIVLDNFIQQINMYNDLFDDSILYYSSNIHTFNDQDPSVITFEVNVNDINVITGGSLRRIGADSREAGVGYLFNVSVMAMCCEPYLVEEYLKQQQKDKVKVIIETPNNILKEMIGLYFERSGFKVVDKIESELNAIQLVKVKVNEQNCIVTFDEIEFGSIQLSIQIYEKNKICIARDNMNILDVIEFLKTFQHHKIDKNQISLRIAEFDKEIIQENKEKIIIKNKFIPVIPLQSDYIKMIMENGIRTTLNEIQKDKHFDKMTFNKITEKVKMVNSFITSIAFTISSPKIVIFYSSIDEEYVTLVVNPSNAQKL
ncbi:interferon-induced, double-stranded RNA-activated protein kinase [Entamoeba histolytica HM-3:IMSS]|uniref:Interferon-induced, double-stranded RNA-activated protein kinase n=1 Tax=Entamoeba histolytica HM-3:IMSS TaxID=885315 RepID=M7W6T3_ENTHI|nr:interferon-induced, double-stranded RNA-activated protein kinase [Entamoeba histolytica HM-3:IMSS]